MQLKHDAANAPTSLDIVNFYIGVRSAAWHQVAVGCVACPVAHHCEFSTWACPLSSTYYLQLLHLLECYLLSVPSWRLWSWLSAVSINVAKIEPVLLEDVKDTIMGLKRIHPTQLSSHALTSQVDSYCGPPDLRLAKQGACEP